MSRRAALVLVGMGAIGCGGEERAPAAGALPDARARIALPPDAAPAGPIAVPAPAGPYDGPDCSPSHAPRPDRDPSPMCFAPGGSFQMGAPADDTRTSAASKPRHRVTLSPFFVDQHEVTAEQFLRFLASPEARPVICEEIIPDVCGPVDNHDYLPYIVGGSGRVTSDYFRAGPMPGYERNPVVLVSFAGAHAYCAWAGKALPTEAQWEYAAGHDPMTGADRAFPWGDRFEARRVECPESVCPDKHRRSAPVGRLEGDRSAIGLFDMYGNVSEWVAACVLEPYDDCGGDCRDPAPALECPTYWGFRGDSIVSMELARPFPVWGRPNTNTPDGDRDMGFRCATTASVGP